jgi:predicted RNase H-like HicB family nuclease
MIECAVAMCDAGAMKEKMKFLITMFQDEDGMFIAECPSIPGCVSQGSTAEEAEKNIQQAIKECLAVRAEKGMPLTVMTREVEVLI